MSPRTAPQDRREHILDAAQELLAQHGASGLSVRKVAAAAGIGASTLRYYFPTSNDLVLAVVKRNVDSTNLDLRIADSSLNPEERLQECLAQFMPTPGSENLALTLWATTITAAVGTNHDPLAKQSFGALSHHAKEIIMRWTRLLAEEGTQFTHTHEEMADIVTAQSYGLSLMILTEENFDLDTALQRYRRTIHSFFTQG